MIEVVCQGSPSEMGHAQGRALRHKILGAREALRSIEAFRVRQPRWMPYPLYLLLAARQARAYLAAPLTREHPRFNERLAGLAAGAGVGLATSYLFNAMEPLLSSIGGCTACPGACSVVAVRGARAAGRAMLAHNFDYLPLVQPFYAVRETRPPDGFRALEFTAAPLAGTIDGINQEGLCVTYDYAFATDTTAAAAPISMLISEALRLCATVEQAAAWIAGQRRVGGGLLMLADAGGDLASLELSNTRSHLRRPAPGEDALFHTNDFSSPHLREVQIADDAVYAAGSPTPLRGRRVHQSSEERNRRYRELLAASPVIDETRLGVIMADHGPAGEGNDFTPCVHGAYWFTTACIRLFPKERRMRVSYSTACQARFQEATLA
jgi:hypothetical protein